MGREDGFRMIPLQRFVVVLCLLAAPCGAHDSGPWVESFDKVWQTVRERHWDREKTGASWDTARAELRPRVEQAQSPEQARGVLQELLGRLGQSHFGIIPGAAYAALESGKDPGDAMPGFEVRMVGGDPVVSRVLPGTAAAEAGVKPGWAVRRIDGQEVAPVLEKLKERPMLQAVLLSRRLQGEDGQSLTVVFDTGQGEEREVALRLATPPGRPVQFGHLPPLRMNIEREEVRPGIVHLRWNAFFEPQWLQDELKAAVEGCAGRCQGIILDVRGNGGGLGMLAAGVTGWFLKEQNYLGTIMAPTGPLKLVAYPRPVRFEGKLALLMDGLSASTSEFLAAGLKDLGRARLFGERTPGMALPSVIELLPSGDRFQYAVADYVSLGGSAVEGVGVEPDAPVPLTRAGLLAGRDEALDAALAWIVQ
jgi:carboxyl-terminal processing protease